MTSVVGDLRRLKPVASPTPRMIAFADTSTSARHGSSNDFESSRDEVKLRVASGDQHADLVGYLVIDDSERATRWAAECGLRGVLVRRRAGEPFEDSVLRAFDEVQPLV
jgi:hypothetical protein